MDDTVRKLAWEGLQKNMVMNGDMMTDRKTSEMLNPEADSMYWEDKDKDFMVFVDHKITCRNVEELHILNSTDTLDT